MTRNSIDYSEVGQARGPVRTTAPGPIYSFVPAHSASNASAVARELTRALSDDHGRSVLLASLEAPGYSVWQRGAPRRLDGRTWGAFVFEAYGQDLLDASEVVPSQIANVFDYARHRYSLVCADLSGAKESQSVETLSLSDAVFVVGGADPASLEMVCDKTEWLRSMGLEDRCGLILVCKPGGATAGEAEDLTGLPVCCVLAEGDLRLTEFAAWLSAEHAVMGTAAGSSL